MFTDFQSASAGNPIAEALFTYIAMTQASGGEPDLAAFFDGLERMTAAQATTPATFASGPIRPELVGQIEATFPSA